MLHALKTFFAGAMRFASGGEIGARASVKARIETPTRLRGAAPDMRTADPTVAKEFESGVYSFAGKLAQTSSQSPFALTPPSRAWRRTLAGFSWLRHLRAADTPGARKTARALVQDFLEMRSPAADDAAQEPGTIARRVLNLMAHAPFLLEDAEPQFSRLLLQGLAVQAKSLAAMLTSRRAKGVDRLLCALALFEFTLCTDSSPQLKTQARQAFLAALSEQMLSDGGHVSRNPRTTLDLSLDLLALRQLMVAQGVKPPAALTATIDKMISLLRLLQHGDGALARFNGMGAGNPGALATVFAHEPSGEPHLEDARPSGYSRMARGGTTVIMDTGAPPPKEYSREAHAGALSFELSFGPELVVVNSGSPLPSLESAREAARETQAHSTLCLDEQSSSRIAPLSEKADSGLILEHGRTKRARRRSTRFGDALSVDLDGYARRYGLRHDRLLILSRDGSRLLGQDRLSAVRGAKAGRQAHSFALRFHLHPQAQAVLSEDGRSAEVTLPSGAQVRFFADGPARLEEGRYGAAPEGPRPTTQIVVRGEAAQGARLRWSFERVAQPAGAKAEGSRPAIFGFDPG
ncbi:heparinase II/III family protein [Methylocystis bryophila]|uniref:Heparinase II/III-like C-terminal domain-containing protein n=1 Tax=Methylocystis bryophila TaxID=655015 RepID=A0A1W6MWJ7_9HYPH|nr:heparinase II/III family protein [Methylocystis bryophila]ARN81935.1 hypothetical protein B1812_13515 [Methylocystis bryophila]BDV38025.1 heparinase [Methylocystis bryophila]